MIAALWKLGSGYVGYAALAVAIAGGAAWMLHEHDNRVRAEQQVAIDAANAAELAKDHTAIVAALEQTAADAESRAEALGKLKGQIHAQPSTNACVGSPAMRAALDGLRAGTGGPRATPASPGRAAGVP